MTFSSSTLHNAKCWAELLLVDFPPRSLERVRSISMDSLAHRLNQRNLKMVPLAYIQLFFHKHKDFRNLPFDIHNRYKLTALFTIFFTSAFSLPFIVVRHQILKK